MKKTLSFGADQSPVERKRSRDRSPCPAPSCVPMKKPLSLGADVPAGQRRTCQTCAHIQDPGHWCVLKPSISLENGECLYTVSSAAGSYECLESGLRWLCAGPVTLQYRISKEQRFWAQLQMLGYRPAGPLLEIKLPSGELEEVHLPHSLCLGGSDLVLLGDAVRALHGDDSSVSLEKCELSRFHGKLSTQHFSLWQLVVRLFSSSSVKDHCEVLIYEKKTQLLEKKPQPLVLYTYLLPTPSPAIQAVKEKWQQRGVDSIDKPLPDHPLVVGSKFQLRCSPDSFKITPREITLSDRIPSNFFEVYQENPQGNFKMEIKTGVHTVWEAELRQGVDYTDTRHTPAARTEESSQTSRTPGEIDSQMAAAFLEKKRPQLIQRATEVKAIADQLLPQRVIGQETYANIQAATTSQDQMRLLFDGLRSAGAHGKLAFYTILQEQQPHLVKDLWAAR